MELLVMGFIIFIVMVVGLCLSSVSNDVDMFLDDLDERRNEKYGNRF